MKQQTIKNRVDKIIVVLCFIGFCSVWLNACNTTQILKRVDTYYSIVKMIVLEPEVQAILTSDQKEKLEKIDEAYQVARKLASSDESKLQTILQCGVDVCDMLSDMPISSDRKKEVKALRIGIKVLQTSLQDQ